MTSAAANRIPPLPQGAPDRSRSTRPDRVQGGAVTEDWRAVGEVIRFRMRELRIKQKMLAEYSGVSVSTIRQMTNNPGGHQQNERTLEALSETLGWPPEYLTDILEGAAAGQDPAAGQAGEAAPALHYLDVSCLGELADHDLAGRRAALLRVVGSAGPGAAAGATGAALALATVVAEQDTRAALYARYRDTRYRCTCGHECAGMEAMDEHLHEYPGDEAHDEVWARDEADARDSTEHRRHPMLARSVLWTGTAIRSRGLNCGACSRQPAGHG
jgi:transcriptional regulator with XRE-family HTH domain